MLNRIITLIIKELQILIRDKKTRLILIVPPILQLLVFVSAATLEVRNISLGVYDRDNTVISRELVRRFEYSPYFTTITPLRNLQEQKAFIDGQKGLAVLSIPPDFARKLEGAEPAEVQLITDGRRSNSAQIVNGYVARIVSEFRPDGREMSPIDPSREAIRVRNWYNPNLDYMYFMIPSMMGILCMMMGLIIPALSVAREREFGTFDQIMVSPLNSSEILIGKTIPSIIIGVLQATLMMTVGVLVYHQPLNGSLALLYLAITVFITSVTGIGLFISSICKTQQQAIVGAFAFGVPAVLISGYATPVENMPDWLQTLSLADPVRHFMVISRGIFLKAMPFDIVLESLQPLFLIALITLAAAGWFFRKKLN